MPISVFVTEIALALNHMHNKGIIYRSVISVNGKKCAACVESDITFYFVGRDVKPSNVLICVSRV